MMRVQLPILISLAALLTASPAAAVRCPNMYIVLDRSGSMDNSYDPPPTKWESAKTAITAFTTSSNKNGLPRQQTMRFGLMVFPNHNSEGCSSGENVVGSDFFTANAINGALANPSYAPYDCTTPLASTLGVAKGLQWLTDSARKRFVILITDGQPNCDTNAVQNSKDQLAAMLTQGVKTFVVGFGSGVDPSTLNSFATAGGTARNPPGTNGELYYVANDTASLGAVLDAIATVASGEMGTQVCDDSCYSNGCPAGQLCTQKFVSYGSVSLNLGQCVADTCLNKTCGENQFCRSGQCVDACIEGCQAGEVCKDGNCVADPGTSTCNPACDRHLVCQAGACIDSPCNTLGIQARCPASAPFCEDTFGGNCTLGLPMGEDAGFLPIDPGADAGRGHGTGAQPVGCGCSTSGAMSSLALLGALALVRRRR